MIKAKQLPGTLLLFSAWLVSLLLRWRFNKLTVNHANIQPNHSYLLLCNHFSFWDGFFGVYAAYKAIYKKHGSTRIAFYIMSLEKQLRQHLWIRYAGAFSIAPGIRKIEESMNYAAGLLDQPGSILLYFPQGNLESCHVQTIVLQDGIKLLAERIRGDCQVIWCSTIVEYFESLTPSLTFNILDCGITKEFDFERVSAIINAHHKEALKKQVRFTQTPLSGEGQL